jgi:hypothetical protein
MEDWLVDQVMFLGLQFQNWMVITVVLVLLATLINIVEHR